jgi:hypothetical protein
MCWLIFLLAEKIDCVINGHCHHRSMEKVISKKIDDFLLTTKEAIQMQLQEVRDTPNVHQLWDYINHYDKMPVTANELTKKNYLDKLNQKIKNFIDVFKVQIKAKMSELDLNLVAFSQFIDTLPTLTLDADDVAKRKRQQNVIPDANRCLARLANQTQCTRKKVFTHNVCGTHLKNIPFGLIDNSVSVNLRQLDVSCIEIRGIVYFIDAYHNVYDPQAVLANQLNPPIIAKAVIGLDGDVHIPELCI